MRRSSAPHNANDLMGNLSARTASMLTHERVAELKEAFSLFTKSGNESISVEEMLLVMRSAGQSQTESGLKKIIDYIDSNGDGNVEFPEFLALMALVPQVKSLDVDQLCQAFHEHDRAQTGLVTREQFVQLMTTKGDPLTEEEVSEMLAGAPVDENGNVDYRSFVLSLTTSVGHGGSDK